MVFQQLCSQTLSTPCRNNCLALLRTPGTLMFRPGATVDGCHRSQPIAIAPGTCHPGSTGPDTHCTNVIEPPGAAFQLKLHVMHLDSRCWEISAFNVQHALHPPTPVVLCTEYPIPLPINSPISSSSSFSSRPNPLLCLMTIAPVSPVCFVIRRQLGTFYSNASGLGRCLFPLAMVRILLKFAKSEPMDP